MKQEQGYELLDALTRIGQSTNGAWPDTARGHFPTAGLKFPGAGEDEEGSPLTKKARVVSLEQAIADICRAISKAIGRGQIAAWFVIDGVRVDITPEEWESSRLWVNYAAGMAGHSSMNSGLTSLSLPLVDCGKVFLCEKDLKAFFGEYGQKKAAQKGRGGPKPKCNRIALNGFFRLMLEKRSAGYFYDSSNAQIREDALVYFSIEPRNPKHVPGKSQFAVWIKQWRAENLSD